jgi:CheY-like chemotaxis protein
MPTVLVVEDDAQIREIVKDELEDAGYTVVIASHADAAIVILEACHDIHLVFTDIDMPGSMDGLKLAACVRDRWPPVHIIITTGKARPATIPANALFIPKPYVGRNVVAAMRTFENM